MLNYQTIDEKSLMFEVAPVLQETEHTFEYAMKLLLAEKYGANEVHSYIWHYEDFCKEHKIDCKPVLKLLDSKNAGQSGIRTMIVPTLLKLPLKIRIWLLFLQAIVTKRLCSLI